ncbi:MurR/RpiR family transcriptional regulator [Clostridium sp. 19966]|uniref:MurR/RpiR family transcriptional regulator n=1 Tax=Clostridium sp. 19966 TaxID=2768166 RepID=UPI0028DE878B|nr:MurR/RpiR family transcriptional regulator [Clostridium sp. 19966]MDT8716215.1 MurR/RpiR family transcriptional regulator [Clostridium sp. 19966]
MWINHKLEYLKTLSSSEKILAEYILNNGEDILSMSSHQLASATYTSPATVIRFCKKLGFKGYSDFKFKYSVELKSSSMQNENIDFNLPFKKGDSIKDISYNLGNLYKESIEDTLKSLNFNTLNSAVDLLLNSKIIKIFGVGSNSPYAVDFQYKMMRIGYLVQMAPLPTEQHIFALNSSEDTCAILISYSGETQDIIDIAHILKNNNTPIVAITSCGDNRLSKYAQYKIHVCSRENIVSKISTFSSGISIQFVLDIIFSCVFEKNYNNNLAHKVNHAKQVEAHTKLLKEDIIKNY